MLRFLDYHYSTLRLLSIDISLVGLAAGTHSIIATYSGDANFNPNASSILSIAVVAPPAADYALTVSSARLSIAAGQSGTLNLNIAANAGVSAGTGVTFACSGLPGKRRVPSIQRPSRSPLARPAWLC